MSLLKNPQIIQKVNEDCRVGLESQNLSFIQTEQPLDGSISVITASVAESALLDNKNPIAGRRGSVGSIRFQGLNPGAPQRMGIG